MEKDDMLMNEGTAGAAQYEEAYTRNANLLGSNRIVAGA
jgi:hypothetical protein